MQNTFKFKALSDLLSGLFMLIYKSWILLTVWILLIVSSLIWNITEKNYALLEEARIHARDAFNKDILYRSWNASHGGVYVPVTEKTQPNLYLPPTVERDIKTLSGKSLTLMNPAYMTRQVHEMGKKKYGFLGHITSLKPIRSQNKPDPWEKKALQRFEQGETEISSVEIIEDNEYMRLMKPLFTEKSCLKCHAVQGYKEGDIRGGISVAVPMLPLRASSQDHIFTIYVVHYLFLLIGVIGIIASKMFLSRSEMKRLQTEDKLRAYFEKAPSGYQSLDENGCFIDVNETWLEILQYSRDEVIGKSFAIFLTPGATEKFGENFPCFKEAGEILGIELEMVKKDGSHVVMSINGRISYDEKGDFKQTHCILTDITERKKAEEELKTRTEELEKINKAFVGRELRMAELKKEIEELEKRHKT